MPFIYGILFGLLLVAVTGRWAKTNRSVARIVKLLFGLQPPA
jgi:hypothetical protein